MNLIDQLRRPCRYLEAVSLDEEHIAQIEKVRDENAAPSSPRMSEYGPVEERLDALIDAVNQSINVAIAAAGGRPGKVTPRPRPETAFEVARHRRRQADHDALVGRLLRRKRPAE